MGSDGYELGNELAQALDGGEGVWVEYLWPHPVTLKEVPKVGYAVRHDGMLFASGYYVQVEDPAADTQEYVQTAIEYYQANGHGRYHCPLQQPGESGRPVEPDPGRLQRIRCEWLSCRRIW